MAITKRGLMRVGGVLAAVVVALAVVATLALAWHRYGPRDTPAGQPPLQTLEASTLEAFKRAFNEAEAKTRVVVLLSPT